MLNDSNYIAHLTIITPTNSILPYTTILQTGILVKSNPLPTVGEFLFSLPGFTSQYIHDRIETIFLNGFPVDDIETVIDGPAPVLAISAAMPGLAGAIFRRNGFHAPLRTSANKTSPDSVQHSGQVLILLKFFNIIVSERGAAVLHNGCLMRSNNILRFMNYRPQLFSDQLSLRCDDKQMNIPQMKSILQKSETVFLKIQEDAACNKEKTMLQSTH